MATCRRHPLFSALVATCLAAGCWHDFDEPFSQGAGGNGNQGGGPTSGGSDPEGGSRADGGGGSQGEGGFGGSVDFCADGTFCAPPPPEGWTGPVVLYEGSEQALPECQTEAVVPMAYVGSVTAGDATCNACGCASPTGGSCNPVHIDFFDNCNNSSVINVENLTVGVCEFTSVPGTTDGSAGLFPTASVAAAGSCTPTGGGVSNLPPVVPGTVARACAATPLETCEDGTCIAAPAGFLNAVCIAQEGDVECPGGVYHVRHLTNTSLDDQRGCTNCSCADPTGTSCSATVITYSALSCLTPRTVVASGMCTTVTHDVKAVQVSSNSITSPGTCAESGGDPTGSVLLSGAWTVCCTD